MKNEKNYMANEAFHWNKKLSTNLFFQKSGVSFYSKQDCQKSIYSGEIVESRHQVQFHPKLTD